LTPDNILGGPNRECRRWALALVSRADASAHSGAGGDRLCT
jgi:hypothetical protein